MKFNRRNNKGETKIIKQSTTIYVRVMRTFDIIMKSEKKVNKTANKINIYITCRRQESINQLYIIKLTSYASRALKTQIKF